LKEVQTLVCATGGIVTWTPLLVAFPQQGALDFTRLIWTVWPIPRREKIILENSLESDGEGQPRSYGKTLNFENGLCSSVDLARYFTDFSLQISHLTNGRLNPRKLYKNWVET
jgi:hypothetical protein